MKTCHWVAVLSMMLAGCSERAEDTAGMVAEGAARPVVFASNYPLKYFAERISAPLVDVRLPVPAGEDPAFWKPTPEDILALQRADLVVLNGASYESWLKNVSMRTARLVDTSEGFKEQLIARREATTHSHGLDGKHEHSPTAFTTWLDLTLAVEQARAIKDAFSTRWPEHKGQFEIQFDKLSEELGELDGALELIVAAKPDLPVIFSHPVYPYFARRYRVNGRSVHWEPGEAPTDAMWQELAALLRSHPAKWMVWEDDPVPDTVAKLEDLGIGSVVFNPSGNDLETSDFLAAMRENAVELRRAYEAE